MKKILGISAFLLVLCGCNDKVAFSELKRLHFDELDQKLEQREDMVVYFGWTQNCEDSIHFQENYLADHLSEDSAFLELYVVDLDEELPDALTDKEKREPMFERYGVKYSPTLVQYEKGEIVKLLEWTPETTDKETGILASRLDRFFTEVGYLKK